MADSDGSRPMSRNDDETPSSSAGVKGVALCPEFGNMSLRTFSRGFPAISLFLGVFYGFIVAFVCWAGGVHLFVCA